MNVQWRFRRLQLTRGLRQYVTRLQSRSKAFFNTYIVGKTLRQVERFVLAWTLVPVLAIGLLFAQSQKLDAYYLEPGAAPGGAYIEGLVGEAGIINPLFATEGMNQSASKLVFSSLFRHGPEGKLEPDLTADWQLSKDQTRYTIKLRQDVLWHDGQLLNADDVIFTHELLQNPDVGSPLELSWRGIKAAKTDDYTVVFTLPNPYAPFLEQLTHGILPEHLLRDIPSGKLRVAAFSSAPIGSGPFRFDSVGLDGNSLLFSRNRAYYGQAAALETLQLRGYESETAMIDDYNRGQLSAMLLTGGFNKDRLRRPANSQIQQLSLASQAFVFFNTEQLDDRQVRQALAQSLDVPAITLRAGADYRPAESPLLPDHLGYEPSQVAYDRTAALQTFKEAGWQLRNGSLIKDNQPLRLELLAPDSEAYRRTAEMVVEQWRQAGVEANLKLLPALELQEDRLRPRDYSAVMIAVNLGSDPDVYAYWHSSQIADPGRNLSLYSSEIADEALAAGRTRHEPALRAAKYQAFQERWQRDVPAIALYGLSDSYVTRSNVRSVTAGDIAGSADRFYNVTNWTVQTQPTLQRLQ